MSRNFSRQRRPLLAKDPDAAALYDELAKADWAEAAKLLAEQMLIYTPLYDYLGDGADWVAVCRQAQRELHRKGIL